MYSKHLSSFIGYRPIEYNYNMAEKFKMADKMAATIKQLLVVTVDQACEVSFCMFSRVQNSNMALVLSKFASFRVYQIIFQQKEVTVCL